MCDDGESGDDFGSAWRKARKQHKCCACREVIRPGDRYRATVQKYDGEFREYKHCARCWSMAEALWKAGAYSVQLDLHCGVLWEEEFGELPDSVARLAFMLPDEAQAEVAK